MELVAFWLIGAVVTGIVAASRGRSGFGWFLLGCLISFFALILVALLPSKRAAPPVQFVGGEVATPKTHVRCPECKGLVHKEARKCMHCGATLIPASEQPAHPGALAGSSSDAPSEDDRAPGAFDSELPAGILADRMGQWMHERQRKG